MLTKSTTSSHRCCGCLGPARIPDPDICTLDGTGTGPSPRQPQPSPELRHPLGNHVSLPLLVGGSLCRLPWDLRQHYVEGFNHFVDGSVDCGSETARIRCGAPPGGPVQPQLTRGKTLRIPDRLRSDVVGHHPRGCSIPPGRDGRACRAVVYCH
jgi:hypothetical protein